MPNFVALGTMVSDKKIFKDFKKFSVLLPWQPEFFEGIKFFQEILKRTIPGTFLKFHQNPISSFREEDV